MISSLILVRHDPVDVQLKKGRIDFEPTHEAGTEILWNPEKVFSSPLKRAKLKAERLFREYTVIDEINNIDRGKISGMSKQDILNTYPEFWKSYENDKLTAKHPGGESYEDVIRRVGSFLDNLSGNIGIVAHGAVLRAALVWMGVDPHLAINYHFQAGIAVHWRREWGIPDELDIPGILLNKEVKNALGSEFCELLHQPVRTSEEASKIRGNQQTNGVKSIIISYNEGMASLLVPADSKVRWNPIKKILGKVEMAEPARIHRETGARVGGVPPIGHGLPTYYDPSIIKNIVYFNAGLKSSSIRTSGKVLLKALEKAGAQEVAGLARNR